MLSSVFPRSAMPAPIPTRYFLLLLTQEPDSPMSGYILGQFLKNKEEHQWLKELQGPHAVHAADVLDKFLCVAEYRKDTLRLLRTLCESWGQLPSSYLFRGEVKTNEHPFAPTSRGVEVFQGVADGRLVAVKSLVMYQDDPKRVNKRLAREAVIWKQLHHPNVLPLYGFFIQKERPCLVSPWMENGDIRKFSANKPHHIRFKLLLDVCNGLKYMHDQDIIHGDLKGDNILVDENGRALLADFGLANFDRSRHWLDITSQSTIPGGTPAYMAPELFSRETVGARSRVPLMKKAVDIYALGMVIYEVLTGRRPFHDVPIHLIAVRVLRGDWPRRPSQIHIPEPVWEMLGTCWATAPPQRPALDHVTSMCRFSALQVSTSINSPALSSSSGSMESGSSESFGINGPPFLVPLGPPLWTTAPVLHNNAWVTHEDYRR